MKKCKISAICILVLITLLFTNSYVYACAPGEVYKKVPSSYYDEYYTTPDRIMATNSKTDEYVILYRCPSYKAFAVHGKHNIITYSVTGNKKVVTDKYGNDFKEYKLNLQELSNALDETVRKTGDKSFTLDVPNLPKPKSIEKSKSNVKESPKPKIQAKPKLKEETKTKVEQVVKPKEECKSEVKKEATKPKEESKQEVKEVVKPNEDPKTEVNKVPEPTSSKEIKLEAAKTSNSSKNLSLLVKIGSILVFGGIGIFSAIAIRKRIKLKKK